MSNKKGKGAASSGVKLDTIPTPKFWNERLEIFDKLYAEQQERYAAMKSPITVTLPDGKKMEGEAWSTTPMDIAKKISNSLADKCIVAKVNDVLWDLTRPFEGDASLELLQWEDADGKKVFWHSSAHVLGYAMERVFDCKLSVGPALPEGGYFYEGDTNRPVSEADYDLIKDAMSELVKKKSPYQRLVIKKEDALRLFGYSDFKTKILSSKVPEGGTCTVYKCGNMIDPCRGPHLPDTGRVKAFTVTKNSSSYFEGKAENAVLQRIYGIAFPQDKLLKEWKEIQEEAAKRDHRTIGRQQDLFGFHEFSPGSAFWMPHGTRIYNTMIEFVRKQYWRRGFTEVISPNIFSSKLWMVSGHWQHYQDAMFRTKGEEEFGLKPMNCPGHCLLFGMRQHSYKDLPIRFAEFGVLHRNELTGALTGLTRVRRFQQDDAHIFCRLDQVEDEMVGALDFLNNVYGTFGFQFHLKLSTRPENALGTKEVWDVAEEKLRRALNSYCGIPETVPDPFKDGETFTFDGSEACIKKFKAAERKREKAEGAEFKKLNHDVWELNPGDGAFYGPKIDIQVEDALRRKHQCATIQLDFNLPERFGLKYTLPSANADQYAVPGEKKYHEEESKEKTEEKKPEEAKAEEKKPEEKKAEENKPEGAEKKPEDKKDEMPFVDRTLDANQARPVMIHRAIFGSLERCIAILCEHFGGKWPFWLSPRQAVVIPVAKNSEQYARMVRDKLHDAGFFVDVDESNGTLEKKIRNSQLAQYNFILVCGDKEVEGGKVDVRTRDNARHGQKPVDDVLSWMKQLADSYSRDF